MIESKIYSHLSTTTALTAIVSTRIYPLILPQEPTYPAIAYSRLTADRLYSLGGYLGWEHPMMTIDIYTETYKQAKELTTSIQTAMNAATAFSSLLVSDVDYYEPDMNVYRVVMDFSCWNKE